MKDLDRLIEQSIKRVYYYLPKYLLAALPIFEVEGFYDLC